MVNPTGYTALDLIGFTDKGTYSSSDNYVKNDLVHYSGNIWRCLVDDTSGIAPAEGVNWTLFIGEPTNLVERIIAPVETDPATSAWAVGRQIIFNDNLYEVITAIIAGDALITYEDDPTNANIKLADPVETQLLNVKGNLSNRNLLDNAWFTVNQRGETSSYFADRWMRYASELTFTNNDGVTISGTPSSADERLGEQKIEWDRLKDNIGKSVTLSVLIDGIIYKAVGKIENPTSAWKTHISLYIPSLNILIQLLTYGSSPSIAEVYLKSVNTDAINVTIKAIKLELGSISTLAMDTAPNYAEELLKCQRYCIALNQSKTSYDFVGQGIAWSNSIVTLIIPIPITMRAKPTITDISKWILYNPSGSAAITSANVAVLSGNSIKIEFSTSSGAVQQGDMYFVGCGNPGDLLLLSVDL